MINQTKRHTANKNSNGIKMLIMTGSLAATLGGWGILAVGQARDAFLAARQVPAAVSQPVDATSPQTTTSSNSLRQVSPPAVSVRPAVRTRSSR